ncbi:MAG TPA: spore coat protein [Pilimelia sp.]|nr:spore coat protein [Pilimelia sp.]
MRAEPSPPVRVGLRCDAGPTTGVGHLVRCVALAEELRARGAAVSFLADLGGVDWARRQLAARGLALRPAPPDPRALVAAARELDLDAVVLDSYELDPGHAAALRADGRVVAAIVDGDLRGQPADVYVDQNLDAEHARVAVPRGAVRLAGLPYALLRAEVRRLRPPAPRPARDVGRPRVVCFFGGTDAYRAAPVLTRLLVATGAPCDAVVVAADAELAAELAALRPAAGQAVTPVAPTDRLPELLAGADLAVSASGTSTWELLCLGVPSALVWVVDNQWLGYRRVTARGLAAGLGRLDDLRTDTAAARAATATLRGLLTDPGRRRELGRRAWAAIDAGGPRRVAGELLRQVAARRRAATDGGPTDGGPANGGVSDGGATDGGASEGELVSDPAR